MPFFIDDPWLTGGCELAGTLRALMEGIPVFDGLQPVVDEIAHETNVSDPEGIDESKKRRIVGFWKIF